MRTRDIRPAPVPTPEPRPVTTAAATPAVVEHLVPAAVALPVYEDSEDPAVTTVLLPELTSDEVERFYRGRSGKVTLPPMAQLPVIETDSIRTALAGASE